MKKNINFFYILNLTWQSFSHVKFLHILLSLHSHAGEPVALQKSKSHLMYSSQNLSLTLLSSFLVLLTTLLGLLGKLDGAPLIVGFPLLLCIN